MRLPATQAGTAADDLYMFVDIDVPLAGLTISDPGGIDTFSAFLLNGAHSIDLRTGGVSTIGGNKVSIASDTVIENATGNAGDDVLLGNDAANTLSGQGGNDQLSGGLGIDTAVFMGAFAASGDYTLTGSGTSTTVSDRVAGRDGTDTLQGIERLKFTDVYVALDIDGHAGQAYRLYQAALNRAPEASGLGFQMRDLDRGVSLALVAQNFIDSPEFSAIYGSLNTVQFVTQLYANVLHRGPDAGGLAFHVGNLNSGANTRADVLAGFSESPESQAALIGTIQNGMIYTV